MSHDMIQPIKVGALVLLMEGSAVVGFTEIGNLGVGNIRFSQWFVSGTIG